MQSSDEEVIRIGGEAGMGLESSGVGFSQALMRSGLHIFGLPDYHSRIRGGHNFFTVRHLGAVVPGGYRFVSGYPMTPGSPVLEWMTAHAAEYGVVTLQVEDEIAALCMAIGAGYAGVRAMAPTFGGGFSLMVEAMGLAGMTEGPVVVYEAHRPGHCAVIDRKRSGTGPSRGTVPAPPLHRKRHLPPAIPGHPKAVYASSSDEHDEYGHIEEDAENRRRVHEKRMRKLETARSEMRPPTPYGPDDAKLTFLA